MGKIVVVLFFFCRVYTIAIIYTENKSEKLLYSVIFSILRLTFYGKSASKS